MTKNTLITFALTLCSVTISQAVFAQDGVAELAQLGPDGTKLANAYLSPIFKGFGIGLNSGWTNTAHSKNLGRFDLRFSVSGAMVPEKDKTFNFNSLGLSNSLRLASGESAISPTASGEDRQGPLVEIYNNNIKIDEINLPEGADISLVPAPQLQATLGLIKGIDVSLRAIPKIKLGDVGSVNMIGGGLKVELIPLIAGKTAGKLLPFDLALALGYTQFSYDKNLDYSAPDNSNLEDNQTIEAKISGMNYQAILSKKLLAFTPFVSLGYNSSKTSGGLKGDYRVIDPALSTVIPVYKTVTDPVSLDSENFNSFRSDIGFQLNLAIFRLYASYSISEYNSFNAGFGFGFGK